jgi:adenylylsulfate kinase
MIIHLIGQPGAGKTTLAQGLKKEIVARPIIIDGDDLRDIFKNKDYSEEGRRRNLTTAYNIARFLDAKGFTPILAMVSPFADLREELKSSAQVYEFFLTTTQTRGREDFFVKEYQRPTDNYIMIDTDFPIDECIDTIINHITPRHVRA